MKRILLMASAVLALNANADQIKLFDAALRCSTIAGIADNKVEYERLTVVAAIALKKSEVVANFNNPEFNSLKDTLAKSKIDFLSYVFGRAQHGSEYALDKELPIPNWSSTEKFNKDLEERQLSAKILFDKEHCSLIK